MGSDTISFRVDYTPKVWMFYTMIQYDHSNIPEVYETSDSKRKKATNTSTEEGKKSFAQA